VWSTGANALDCAIGPAGLDPHGVHEVRPAFAPTPDPDDEEPGGRRDWAAGWAAAQAFALMLAACRRRALPGPNRPILWCAPPALLREAGWPYAPGLARVGLAPANLLVVAPARTQDALWVLEEALKSEALALVVGLIECVALTPARRLALAAAHHHTPCLLLTDPRRAPTAATATRWSVAPAPSAPHPLVPRAPGLPRLSVTLARNRLAPVASPQPVEIEWCDEAYRFLMAPGLATRPPAAHPRQRRAG
jgi:protein ImuA